MPLREDHQRVERERASGTPHQPLVGGCVGGGVGTGRFLAMSICRSAMLPLRSPAATRARARPVPLPLPRHELGPGAARPRRADGRLRSRRHPGRHRAADGHARDRPCRLEGPPNVRQTPGGWSRCARRERSAQPNRPTDRSDRAKGGGRLCSRAWTRERCPMTPRVKG